MKTIMKTFSGDAVAAITSLAILIILTGITVAGHTGIFDILGSRVTVNNADYSGYNAAAANTQDILAGEPVQILYDDTADRIYAGTDAEILSRISIIRDGNTENAQDADRVKVLYVKDKEGNEINLLDVIESVPVDIVEECYIRENTTYLLQSLKKILSEKEYQVICYRYGLFGMEEETQREIAQKLCISRSYVSRIEKTALQKLRGLFPQTE